MAKEDSLKVETEQNVQATEPVGDVDWKALYHDEIQGRKKERSKRQGLESELGVIKSRVDEERQLKMIAEGKKDDVITEQAEKLKRYETRLEDYDKQEAAQREKLLEGISEDERVHYDKMDLIQLQHFVSKEQSGSTSNPPQAVQGRSNATMDLDDFMKQSESKKREGFSDILKQYQQNSRGKA